MDALLLRENEVIVFEVKLHHTAAAWWQLRQLYSPVVATAFGLPVRVCTVTRFVDPAVAIPEEIDYLFDESDLRRWVDDGRDSFAALRFR